MFECETHHYLDGYATPQRGGGGPKSTRFRLRRPVMVDPITNGAYLAELVYISAA
jgi:hypothetical protein